MEENQNANNEQNNKLFHTLISMYLLGEKSLLQVIKQLQGNYQETSNIIEDKINAFYGKYNINDKTTYMDITKRLDNKELQQFKKRLYQIIKYAEKHNFDKTQIKQFKILYNKIRITRLNELETNIRFELCKLSYINETDLHELLYNTYENTYYKTINNIDDYEEEPKKLTSDDIEKILIALYLSKNYIQRIWQNTENTIIGLNQEIPREIIMGYTAQKLVNDTVKPKIERISYNNAVQLARTEYNKVFNEGVLKAYDVAGIEMYKIVAALEMHPAPCKFCQGLDYRNNSKPMRVKDAIPGINYPPFHANCRCIALRYYENK